MGRFALLLGPNPDSESGSEILLKSVGKLVRRIMQTEGAYSSYLAVTLVPSVSCSGISSGRSFSAWITHKNKQLIAASVADPGYRIREAYPGSGFSPFRILDPGVKKHRIRIRKTELRNILKYI